jgi:2-dehydropantoate 2-reductase
MLTSNSNAPSRILVVGAGAIGCTLGAWLARAGHAVTVLARGAAAEAVRANGLTTYVIDPPAEKASIPVRVVTTLAGEGLPDVVLITVKNYALDAAAGQVFAAFGRDVTIVGLQNGVENQAVLPRFFDTVIYGVMHFNAWLDAPGVAGALRRGPLVLAAPEAQAAALARVRALFAPALPTLTTHRVADAVYSKLILNLTNSVTTLIGFPTRPVSDLGAMQYVLSNLMAEGVASVKAAGMREYKVPGFPTWALIRVGATLPRVLTRGMFKKNLAKMRITSMAQDIQRGSDDNELESLNGPLLALADKHGVKAPVSRVVYTLCRERFAQKPFVPMDVRDVLAAVQKT